MASDADQTPEGKSIVKLFEKQSGNTVSLPDDTEFRAFYGPDPHERVDLPDGRLIRKGAPDAVIKFVMSGNGSLPDELKGEIKQLVDSVASKGATPAAGR